MHAQLFVNSKYKLQKVCKSNLGKWPKHNSRVSQLVSSIQTPCLSLLHRLTRSLMSRGDCSGSRIEPDVGDPVEVVHVVDVLKGAVHRVARQLLLQRRLAGPHLVDWLTQRISWFLDLLFWLVNRPKTWMDSPTLACLDCPCLCRPRWPPLSPEARIEIIKFWNNFLPLPPDCCLPCLAGACLPLQEHWCAAWEPSPASAPSLTPSFAWELANNYHRFCDNISHLFSTDDFLLALLSSMASIFAWIWRSLSVRTCLMSSGFHTFKTFCRLKCIWFFLAQ